ncbi:MAG: hypothetical protein HDQ92_08805 [Desulfovibrio sp.]|nr:hypothetical protein [Desulfovibrio sp.]
MPATPVFPVLDSATKCAALWPQYPEMVVGMWATRLPRQNVDVLWRLREELLNLGVPVVFFFNESAKPLLEKLIPEPSSLSLSLSLKVISIFTSSMTPNFFVC